MKKLLSYLITDPQYYTDNPDFYRERLNISLNKYHPDFVCLRDKTTPYLAELASITLELAQHYNAKSVLNYFYEEAKNWGFDYCHLTSTQLGIIPSLPSIASCHTQEDLFLAQAHNYSYATLSPLFSTPGKGEGIGIEKFCSLCEGIDIPLLALGGITTKENIDSLSHTPAVGFASIRYFL